jgi:protein TonB
VHISPYIGKKAVPVGVNVVYIPQYNHQLSKLDNQKIDTRNKSKKILKRHIKKSSLIKKTVKLKKAFKAKSFGKTEGVRLNQEQMYIYELRSHIVKFLDYPRAAARLNQTGEVIVQVDIHRSGKIIKTKIAKSCPFFRLNEAALALVNSVEKFSPFPAVMPEQMISVSIPVSYTLN